jgi:hypothetical protein
MKLGGLYDKIKDKKKKKKTKKMKVIRKLRLKPRWTNNVKLE